MLTPSTPWAPNIENKYPPTTAPTTPSTISSIIPSPCCLAKMADQAANPGGNKHRHVPDDHWDIPPKSGWLNWAMWPPPDRSAWRIVRTASGETEFRIATRATNPSSFRGMMTPCVVPKIIKATRALNRMALIGTAEGSVPSPPNQCSVERPVPAPSQYFRFGFRGSPAAGLTFRSIAHCWQQASLKFLNFYADECTGGGVIHFIEGIPAWLMLSSRSSRSLPTPWLMLPMKRFVSMRLGRSTRGETSSKPWRLWSEERGTSAPRDRKTRTKVGPTTACQARSRLELASKEVSRGDDSIPLSHAPGTEFWRAETGGRNRLIRGNWRGRDRTNQKIWQTCLWDCATITSIS